MARCKESAQPLEFAADTRHVLTAPLETALFILALHAVTHGGPIELGTYGDGLLLAHRALAQA